MTYFKYIQIYKQNNNKNQKQTTTENFEKKHKYLLSQCNNSKSYI